MILVCFNEAPRILFLATKLGIDQVVYNLESERVLCLSGIPLIDKLYGSKSILRAQVVYLFTLQLTDTNVTRTKPKTIPDDCHCGNRI